MSDIGLGLPSPGPEPDAVRSRLESFAGALDPLNLAPVPARNFLSTGTVPTPRIYKTLPENLTSLSNKWTELAPFVRQLPAPAQDALIQIDADRVAAGSKPLTRDETFRLAQTWVTGEPATPPPRRKPLNVPGNFLSDLGAAIKSIPKLPSGVVGEALALGQLGEALSGDQGNTIQRIASAPGVRLLPGAFIAENLAGGAEGARTLATHPLFTILDILPAASGAARLTRTGQVATQAARAAGRTPRPLLDVARYTVDDAGTLQPRRITEAVRELRDATTIGRSLDEMFGARSREMMRMVEAQRSRVQAAQRGFGDPTSPIDVATARAVRLTEDHIARYGWTAEDIADITRRGELGDISGMSPEQLSYLNQQREIADVFGNALVDDDLLGRFDGEFYTSEQARNLRAANERAVHYTATARNRAEYLAPGNRLLSSDMLSAINEAMERQNTRWRHREMQSLVNVADAYGVDTAEARNLLRRARDGDVTWSEFANRFSEIVADNFDTATRPLNANEIVTYLNQRARRGRDVQAGILAAALADGNTARITRALNNLERRRVKVVPPELGESIRSLRRRYQDEGQGARFYTRDRAQRARESFENLRNRTPPARFGKVIADRTMEGVDVTVRTPRVGVWERREIPGAREVLLGSEARALGRELTEQEAGSLARAVAERRWGQFSFAEPDMVAKMYGDIEADVAQTWRALRDEGVDPIFVHATTANRVRQTLSPNIGAVPRTLSQTKERATDFSPGIQDAGVALSHQGTEILERRGSLDFIEEVVDKWGIPEAELRETYSVPARAATETNPLWGFEGHLADQINRRYVRFDPDEAGYAWGGPRLDKYRQTATFIPRSMANNLKRMHTPRSPLGGVFDPITKTFRISVIGLSPRTHLYNILGGATMTLGYTGPGVMRYLRQAQEMVRNPNLIDDAALRATIGSQRRIMDDLNDLSQNQARLHIASGRTLGRLFDEAAQSRIGRGTRRLVDRSLDFNAFFDDTYRVMAYLYGYDKALTRGLSQEVAQRAGLELLRKTMMDWSSLTPIERTVFKSVFPFYGFMSHALRYVFRFPVDHPVRAAVVGAFGRAEQEDARLLPDSFLGAFFIGQPSPTTGRQNALNLTAVNPFGDVANMMTFAGFLSATNPALSTVFESVGLNRGEAELYPSLRYNPETGRLDGSRTNPLLAFAQNTIPQSQVLLSLLGANTEFSERLERDPAAAIRTLWSAGGLPVVWRNYSLPEQAFRAELARQDAQDVVLADALRSGDFQNANRYPGLAGISEQIGVLPPEIVAAFTPPESAAIRAQLEALVAGQSAEGLPWQTNPVAQQTLATILEPEPNPVAQQNLLGGF